MSKQASYDHAKAVQVYFAARDESLTVTRGDRQISILVGRSDWKSVDLPLIRSLTEATLERLQPAFTAIFNKLLAEQIESLRLETIAEVEAMEAADAARYAKRLRELRGEPEPTEAGPYGFGEGERCNRDGCQGVLEFETPENCSCHNSAPCVACTSVDLYCPVCQWSAGDDEG